MKYEYEIQVGSYPCTLSFEADNYDSKPYSQLSGSGPTQELDRLAIIMAESDSVKMFEERITMHGATSWNTVPNYAPSSSGMSWGSSSSSEDEE